MKLTCGDILTLRGDALVCPAHKHLIRGRGLSAQIFDRAGEALAEECARLPECPVGGARITSAPNLSVRYLIHTVTPQWSSGDQWGVEGVVQLRQCYENVLGLARERGLRRLLFPALGAGTNRFPHAIAAHQALVILHSQIAEFGELTVCLHSAAALGEWQRVERRFFKEPLINSLPDGKNSLEQDEKLR
ncbi:macro domain-containing protein [Microbulbifer thermotolerans]|uniref:Macro domain-containing protein n=1 Tax=Microbulbifer thermotolerans TaxID=252514 RepID=A0AB35I0E6_MICTH|nr:macro domain-containing protein [Microbulbifer thermotolerans]MCX2778711.1 macro domain-containing protein [Microbulbifer thermotolerans]MCX2783739.1 macro domain-containing protein [Microbulbifer thermotolerans]MCX2803101.1 macro domain-containing protein [Microbulbifer thermotolerans]MCX2803780.1 macro domain-containing protein [Microbulbifer thermotolerans]MCX2833229.1 macro domain-containing protein [Microbulbifer thermotolerans]